MAVRREFSAGGLVLDPQGRLVVIATLNLRGERVVGLPKGHPDPGEGPSQAALREVLEETGLAVELTDEEPAGKIEYWFVARSGERVHKEVVYFRMVISGDNRSALDGEAEEVLLLPLEEAARKLSYRNEQRLVQEVLCS